MSFWSEMVTSSARMVFLWSHRVVAAGAVMAEPGREQPQLIIEFLKAADDRVDDQPRNDEKHSTQYEADGEHGQRQAQHQTGPEEVENHDRTREKAAHHER